MQVKIWILILTGLSIVFSVPHALAEEECSRRDLSADFRDRYDDWNWAERTGTNVEEALEDVNVFLAGSSIPGCEKTAAERVSWRLRAESSDPAISIPVLELFVSSSDAETNPNWNRHVDRLATAYIRSNQYEMAQTFSEEHLPDVDRWAAAALEKVILHAMIGQNDLDGALERLVATREMSRSALNRHDAQFGYALAIRQGQQSEADAFEAYAKKNLDGLLFPGAPPVFEGDELDNLIARNMTTKYLVEMLNLPVPNYPSSAASRGLEGNCEVYFDVDTDGKPVNVEPICTHRYFKRSARKALSDVRFKPLNIDGVDYPMTSIVYPLEYRLGR
ncbi:MAG: TonB family protein [Pseudomonadota bacterium]